MATKDMLSKEKLNGFGDISKAKNYQFMNFNLNQNGSNVRGLLFSKNNSNDLKKDEWLSLHIPAYENSIEASAANVLCSKNDGRKKLTKKELISKMFSSPALQNPFELPRQQKEDKKETPEIAQFKSTQKLLNPESDVPIPDDAIDISNDKSIEVDKLEDVSLREYFFKDANGKPVTIINQLGAGSYGSIFHASHKGKDVAVKLEKRISPKPPSLKNEAEIYQLLHAEKCPYIAQFIEYGEKTSFNYLMMEKCQKSIDSLKKTDENKIDPVSPEQTLIIASQILKGIEYLHKSGYIHRDIKPANFLVGNTKKILIADFGIAAKFYDKNGEIPKKFIGTMIFCPIAAHDLKQQCFKDDMESIVYTLDYLQTTQEKFYNFEDDKKIIKMKTEMKERNAYFENLPKQMRKFSIKIFETKYDERPKYSKLHDVLEKTARKLRFELDGMPFEEDGKTLKKRKEEFRTAAQEVPANDPSEKSGGPRKMRKSSSSSEESK